MHTLPNAMERSGHAHVLHVYPVGDDGLGRSPCSMADLLCRAVSRVTSWPAQAAASTTAQPAPGSDPFCGRASEGTDEDPHAGSLSSGADGRPAPAPNSSSEFVVRKR